MRYVRKFAGFAGVRIESDDIGSGLDPSLILLHDLGETRKSWASVADALVLAGRHAINVDLRGHGGSEWPADQRYTSDAFVADIKSVLGQMRTRPVLIARGVAAWLAALSLADDAALLASGLILVDMPPLSGSSNPGMSSVSLSGTPTHPGQPQWDAGLVDAFSVEGLAEQVAASLERNGLPTLVLRSTSVEDHDIDPALSHLDHAHFGPSSDPDALTAALLEFLERKQPLAAPEFRSGSDSRTLRDAMGVFATGVTIVTAKQADGEPIGLTANSFTSVSLDPPLLLVCIANNSSNALALRQTDHFAVNVLQIGQQPTSSRFAGKAEDRFSERDWEWGETGVPIMQGSLGVFECTRHTLHEAGDHFILVGQVVKASFEPRRDPLLYFRGKYRRLHFT